MTKTVSDFAINVDPAIDWARLRSAIRDYEATAGHDHGGDRQLRDHFQQEVIARDEKRYGACGVSDATVIKFWAERGCKA